MKKHSTEILILFISSILIAFMVLTPTSAVVALVSQTTEENQGNFDFYTLGLLVSDLFIILAG
jgi:hypothetical protein